MKNRKLEKIAIKVFEKALPDQSKQIKSIKDIHNGYTNYSFLFELDNGVKYQVRLPHSGDLINRYVEHEVLKLINNDLFVYFEDKTGVGIKKWIEGGHPGKIKMKSKGFIDSLFNEIKKLHLIKIDTKKIPIKKIQIESFNEYLHSLDFDFQSKYLSLVDKRKNDEVVLSHSDINQCNVIVGEDDKITLIDYEWCCLANDYWDYANWIRETKTNIDKIDWHHYIENFSMHTLLEYVFMCSVFSYAWTYAMPQSRKIIAYRKAVYKQVRYYYDMLINYEQKIK